LVHNLPTLLTLTAFTLHLLGEHRAAVITRRRRSPLKRRRALLFYAGLLTILVALESPLDVLAEKLFWAHMIQHLLLLTVAAPLIVLGHPWMPIWRALPLGLRRTLAHTFMRSPALAPVRSLFALLATPAGAWICFNLGLVLWHLPGPYDATLRHIDVHVLEHTTFLACGILFWAQVIGTRPAQVVMPVSWRIAYVGTTMVVNVGVSIFLAFSQHPLYAPYAALGHRPGGISALADQQIGAGIMWSAGDLPFAIALAALLHRWLGEQEASPLAITAVPTGAVDDERPRVAGQGRF